MSAKALVVHGDTALMRCVNSTLTIVKKVVDVSNFPESVVLEMTSGSHVTIWNAPRCAPGTIPDGTGQLLPLYGADYTHLFATVSCYLGYCKRPRGLWAWFVPLCVSCWAVELPPDNINVSILPCKTLPPYHAICLACASEVIDTSSGCPFDGCLAKCIPLKQLYAYNKRMRKKMKLEEEEDADQSASCSE
jgi:hypothetical protein